MNSIYFSWILIFIVLNLADCVDLNGEVRNEQNPGSTVKPESENILNDTLQPPSENTSPLPKVPSKRRLIFRNKEDALNYVNFLRNRTGKSNNTGHQQRFVRNDSRTTTHSKITGVLPSNPVYPPYRNTPVTMASHTSGENISILPTSLTSDPATALNNSNDHLGTVNADDIAEISVLDSKLHQPDILSKVANSSTDETMLTHILPSNSTDDDLTVPESLPELSLTDKITEILLTNQSFIDSFTNDTDDDNNQTLLPIETTTLSVVSDLREFVTHRSTADDDLLEKFLSKTVAVPELSETITNTSQLETEQIVPNVNQLQSGNDSVIPSETVSNTSEPIIFIETGNDNVLASVPSIINVDSSLLQDLNGNLGIADNDKIADLISAPTISDQNSTGLVLIPPETVSDTSDTIIASNINKDSILSGAKFRASANISLPELSIEDDVIISDDNSTLLPGIPPDLALITNLPSQINNDLVLGNDTASELLSINASIPLETIVNASIALETVLNASIPLKTVLNASIALETVLNASIPLETVLNASDIIIASNLNKDSILSGAKFRTSANVSLPELSIEDDEIIPDHNSTLLPGIPSDSALITNLPSQINNDLVLGNDTASELLSINALPNISQSLPVSLDTGISPTDIQANKTTKNSILPNLSISIPLKSENISLNSNDDLINTISNTSESTLLPDNLVDSITKTIANDSVISPLPEKIGRSFSDDIMTNISDNDHILSSAATIDTIPKLVELPISPLATKFLINETDSDSESDEFLRAIEVVPVSPMDLTNLTEPVTVSGIPTDILTELSQPLNSNVLPANGIISKLPSIPLISNDTVSNGTDSVILDLTEDLPLSKNLSIIPELDTVDDPIEVLIAEAAVSHIDTIPLSTEIGKPILNNTTATLPVDIDEITNLTLIDAVKNDEIVDKIIVDDDLKIINASLDEIPLLPLQTPVSSNQSLISKHQSSDLLDVDLAPTQLPLLLASQLPVSQIDDVLVSNNSTEMPINLIGSITTTLPLISDSKNGLATVKALPDDVDLDLIGSITTTLPLISNSRNGLATVKALPVIDTTDSSIVNWNTFPVNKTKVPSPPVSILSQTDSGPRLPHFKPKPHSFRTSSFVNVGDELPVASLKRPLQPYIIPKPSYIEKPILFPTPTVLPKTPPINSKKLFSVKPLLPKYHQLPKVDQKKLFTKYQAPLLPKLSNFRPFTTPKQLPYQKTQWPIIQKLPIHQLIKPIYKPQTIQQLPKLNLKPKLYKPFQTIPPIQKSGQVFTPLYTPKPLSKSYLHIDNLASQYKPKTIQKSNSIISPFFVNNKKKPEYLSPSIFTTKSKLEKPQLYLKPLSDINLATKLFYSKTPMQRFFKNSDDKSVHLFPYSPSKNVNKLITSLPTYNTPLLSKPILKPFLPQIVIELGKKPNNVVTQFFNQTLAPFKTQDFPSYTTNYKHPVAQHMYVGNSGKSNLYQKQPFGQPPVTWVQPIVHSFPSALPIVQSTQLKQPKYHLQLPSHYDYQSVQPSYNTNQQPTKPKPIFRTAILENDWTDDRGFGPPVIRDKCHSSSLPVPQSESHKNYQTFSHYNYFVPTARPNFYVQNPFFHLYNQLKLPTYTTFTTPCVCNSTSYPSATSQITASTGQSNFFLEGGNEGLNKKFTNQLVSIPQSESHKNYNTFSSYNLFVPTARPNVYVQNPFLQYYNQLKHPTYATVTTPYVYNSTLYPTAMTSQVSAGTTQSKLFLEGANENSDKKFTNQLVPAPQSESHKNYNTFSSYNSFGPTAQPNYHVQNPFHQLYNQTKHLTNATFTTPYVYPSATSQVTASTTQSKLFIEGGNGGSVEMFTNQVVHDPQSESHKHYNAISSYHSFVPTTQPKLYVKNPFIQWYNQLKLPTHNAVTTPSVYSSTVYQSKVANEDSVQKFTNQLVPGSQSKSHKNNKTFLSYNFVPTAQPNIYVPNPFLQLYNQTKHPTHTTFTTPHVYPSATTSQITAGTTQSKSFLEGANEDSHEKLINQLAPVSKSNSNKNYLIFSYLVPATPKYNYFLPTTQPNFLVKNPFLQLHNQMKHPTNTACTTPYAYNPKMYPSYKPPITYQPPAATKVNSKAYQKNHPFGSATQPRNFFLTYVIIFQKSYETSKNETKDDDGKNLDVKSEYQPYQSQANNYYQWPKNENTPVGKSYSSTINPLPLYNHNLPNYGLYAAGKTPIAETKPIFYPNPKPQLVYPALASVYKNQMPVGMPTAPKFGLNYGATYQNHPFYKFPKPLNFINQHKLPYPIQIPSKPKLPYPIQIANQPKLLNPIQLTNQPKLPYPIQIANQPKLLNPIQLTNQPKLPYPIQIANQPKLLNPIQLTNQPKLPYPIQIANQQKLPYPIQLPNQPKLPYPTKIANQPKLPYPVKITNQPNLKYPINYYQQKYPIPHGTNTLPPYAGPLPHYGNNQNLNNYFKPYSAKYPSQFAAPYTYNPHSKSYNMPSFYNKRPYKPSTESFYLQSTSNEDVTGSYRNELPSYTEDEPPYEQQKPLSKHKLDYSKENPKAVDANLSSESEKKILGSPSKEPVYQKQLPKTVGQSEENNQKSSSTFGHQSLHPPEMYPKPANQYPNNDKTKNHYYYFNYENFNVYTSHKPKHHSGSTQYEMQYPQQMQYSQEYDHSYKTDYIQPDDTNIPYDEHSDQYYSVDNLHKIGSHAKESHYQSQDHGQTYSTGSQSEYQDFIIPHDFEYGSDFYHDEDGAYYFNSKEEIEWLPIIDSSSNPYNDFKNDYGESFYDKQTFEHHLEYDNHHDSFEHYESKETGIKLEGAAAVESYIPNAQYEMTSLFLSNNKGHYEQGRQVAVIDAPGQTYEGPYDNVKHLGVMDTHMPPDKDPYKHVKHLGMMDMSMSLHEDTYKSAKHLGVMNTPMPADEGPYKSVKHLRVIDPPMPPDEGPYKNVKHLGMMDMSMSAHEDTYKSAKHLGVMDTPMSPDEGPYKSVKHLGVMDTPIPTHEGLYKSVKHLGVMDTPMPPDEGPYKSVKHLGVMDTPIPTHEGPYKSVKHLGVIDPPMPPDEGPYKNVKHLGMMDMSMSAHEDTYKSAKHLGVMDTPMSPDEGPYKSVKHLGVMDTPIPTHEGLYKSVKHLGVMDTPMPPDEGPYKSVKHLGVIDTPMSPDEGPYKSAKYLGVMDTPMSAHKDPYKSVKHVGVMDTPQPPDEGLYKSVKHLGVMDTPMPPDEGPYKSVKHLGVMDTPMSPDEGPYKSVKHLGVMDTPMPQDEGPYKSVKYLGVMDTPMSAHKDPYKSVKHLGIMDTPKPPDEGPYKTVKHLGAMDTPMPKDEGPYKSVKYLGVMDTPMSAHKDPYKSVKHLGIMDTPKPLDEGPYKTIKHLGAMDTPMPQDEGTYKSVKHLGVMDTPMPTHEGLYKSVKHLGVMDTPMPPDEGPYKSVKHLGVMDTPMPPDEGPYKSVKHLGVMDTPMSPDEGPYKTVKHLGAMDTPMPPDEGPYKTVKHLGAMDTPMPPDEGPYKSVKHLGVMDTPMPPHKGPYKSVKHLGVIDTPMPPDEGPYKSVKHLEVMDTPMSPDEGPYKSVKHLGVMDTPMPQDEGPYKSVKHLGVMDTPMPTHEGPYKSVKHLGIMDTPKPPDEGPYKTVKHLGAMDTPMPPDEGPYKSVKHLGVMDTPMPPHKGPYDSVKHLGIMDTHMPPDEDPYKSVKHLGIIDTPMSAHEEPYKNVKHLEVMDTHVSHRQSAYDGENDKFFDTYISDHPRYYENNKHLNTPMSKNADISYEKDYNNDRQFHSDEYQHNDDGYSGYYEQAEQNQYDYWKYYDEKHHEDYDEYSSYHQYGQIPSSAEQAQQHGEFIDHKPLDEYPFERHYQNDQSEYFERMQQEEFQPPLYDY
ncbi:hypothetical protein CHUAL_011276 [Chamberlinius hualienensis]